jgi:hypothetical protein
MQSKPGRKKKKKKNPFFEGENYKFSRISPTGDREKHLQMIYEERRRHLHKSDLLHTLRRSPESTSVLKHVMEGIAVEVESMCFDRDLAERRGEATSMLSNRIIQGYKAIGDSWLKRKEQVSERELDLTSPAFKNLLVFIIETISESMQTAEIPMAEVKEALTITGEKMNSEDWVLEARKRMRGEEDAETR